MILILLCGGSGTRLWPLSREDKPKQFIQLFESNSPLQQTFLRNQELITQTVVVVNEKHQILAESQLKKCNCTSATYIHEPIGKNTLAAIALALLTVDPEEILFVTPTDIQIEATASYSLALMQAKELAAQGHIVVFGIKPHAPETCYGYIEATDENVKRFHEKPDLVTAQKYLEQGNFYWNSGMLCFQAKAMLHKIEYLVPTVLSKAKFALKNAKRDHNQIRISLDDMQTIPSQSIDHAILEKIDDLKVIKCDFVWNDLGSFDSIIKHIAKDNDGNATQVKSFHSINAKNNLIIGKDRMIAAIDIEDLIIIDTEDALLIAKAGSSQKVKEVVSILKETAPDNL